MNGETETTVDTQRGPGGKRALCTGAAILLGVAVLAGAVSLAVVIRNYQRAAVAEAELTDAGYFVMTETRWPDWTRSWFGAGFGVRYVSLVSVEGSDPSRLPWAREIQSFREVNLFETHLGLEELAFLERQDGLEDLRLEAGTLDIDALAFLRGCKELKDLELKAPLSISQSQTAMSYVGALPSVNRVTLYEMPLNEQAISQLSRASTLQRLAVKGTIQGDALAPLGALSHLEVLMLQTADDQTLASIDNLRSVQHLSISHGNGVTDTSVAKIGQLPLLKTLQLSKSSVTDGALSALANCSRLEELWLDGARVTDAGLIALVRLPSLRLLVLTVRRFPIRR